MAVLGQKANEVSYMLMKYSFAMLVIGLLVLMPMTVLGQTNNLLNYQEYNGQCYYWADYYSGALANTATCTNYMIMLNPKYTHHYVSVKTVIAMNPGGASFYIFPSISYDGVTWSNIAGQVKIGLIGTTTAVDSLLLNDATTGTWIKHIEVKEANGSAVKTLPARWLRWNIRSTASATTGTVTIVPFGS